MSLNHNDNRMEIIIVTIMNNIFLQCFTRYIISAMIDYVIIDIIIDIVFIIIIMITDIVNNSSSIIPCIKINNTLLSLTFILPSIEIIKIFK